MKRRERVLRVWLSEAEKELLQRLAAAQETTQSDTVRRLIREAAQRADVGAQNDPNQGQNSPAVPVTQAASPRSRRKV